jgi:Fe-S-cluster-containing dehydrogenase component
VGAFYPELSRIRVAHPEPTLVMSVACHLCQDPPCVAVCPRQALSINNANGIILLDKVRCVGCGWCIETCDFGAISLDSTTKTVVICDLCSGLPQPKCVELCPKGALSLATVEEIAQRKRDKVVLGQLTKANLWV